MGKYKIFFDITNDGKDGVEGLSDFLDDKTLFKDGEVEVQDARMVTTDDRALFDALRVVGKPAIILSSWPNEVEELTKMLNLGAERSKKSAQKWPENEMGQLMQLLIEALEPDQGVLRAKLLEVVRKSKGGG
jgi:hypothetical protein